MEQEDVNGDTALLIAVAHGHVKAARALLAAGANILAVAADGSTALQVAAAAAAAAAAASSSATRSPGGSPAMFAALLEFGAANLLGSKNSNGDNVYHIISRQKNMLVLLLAASATKDAIHVIAANAKGQSPLMIALEDAGNGDGLAVATELINVSGAFATGEQTCETSSRSAVFNRKPVSKIQLQRGSSCLFCLTRETAFEKLRSKNKSYAPP
jgi:ankyrin repeat protein